MPPPASHRLALLVLRADPDADPAPVEALARGWAGAGDLVADGHSPARLRRSATPVFLANRQGGFRVFCPETGDNLVPTFVPALGAWRAGGPRRLTCACGATHDLAALCYRPEAGFARVWIEIPDVGAAELSPAADRLAKELLGEVRIVLRRG